MPEMSTTPRYYWDKNEFGSNTALRLINEIHKEIEYALESAQERLKMYRRVSETQDGLNQAHTNGAEFECRTAIRTLKDLLEYVQETKEDAL